MKNGKKILEYARAVLKSNLEGAEEPPFSLADEVLEEKRGIFVTLKKSGQLRGCIGLILGYQPLRQSIREMTLAAAFQDPRFPPVNFEELETIKIHISFLTVPKPIRSFHEIRLGKDGIIVTYGRKKGVYLPEVATETGWNQETFFKSCALDKAGLTEEELWKAGIEVFQSEILEE